jgi:DNA-binding MarR family transcriptional regulator
VRAAGRQRERAARGSAEQAALGVEQVEQGKQVVLVDTAAVEEDQRPLGVAGGWADQLLEAPVLVVPEVVGYTGCISNYPTAELLDEVELAAWRGMLRAHAELTRELDAELARDRDMPLSSYEVLLYLNDSDGGRMRMSELADSVLLSRSGLTRLVDRLEREGLLKRERCESDARGLFAEITPEGRRLFDAARQTHLDGVRRLFLGNFSRAELRTLGSLWQRLDEPA